MTSTTRSRMPSCSDPSNFATAAMARPVATSDNVAEGKRQCSCSFTGQKSSKRSTRKERTMGRGTMSDAEKQERRDKGFNEREIAAEALGRELSRDWVGALAYNYPMLALLDGDTLVLMGRGSDSPFKDRPDGYDVSVGILTSDCPTYETYILKGDAGEEVGDFDDSEFLNAVYGEALRRLEAGESYEQIAKALNQAHGLQPKEEWVKEWLEAAEKVQAVVYG